MINEKSKNKFKDYCISKIHGILFYSDYHEEDCHIQETWGMRPYFPDAMLNYLIYSFGGPSIEIVPWSSVTMTVHITGGYVCFAMSINKEDISQAKKG